MQTPARLAALVVVAIALIAYAFAQPSLTPPAGPIEESGRFGNRIEINQTNTPGNADALFVISEPGSYVLTRDADAGELSGIYIASDNVTVDLNGFTLTGQPGAGTFGVASLLSRTSNAVYRNATVRNGTIDGFDFGCRSTNFFIGEFFFSTSIEGLRLERLNISRAETGILANTYCVIDTCMVRANDRGINGGSVVTDTLVFLEAGGPSGPVFGIISGGCTVTGCTVSIQSSLGKNAIGFRLTASTISNSASNGGGIGYELVSSTVANNCSSFNAVASASLLDGSQAYNSNF